MSTKYPNPRNSKNSNDSINPTDSEIEEHRDRAYRRAADLRVENAQQVEQMVEDIGFCAALTDARTNLPSVYIAVCGRRDAHMPQNVQKDQEASLAWVLKDEVLRRGKVYYGKLVKNRAMFLAPRLIPYFQKLWGVAKDSELSPDAQKVLKTLRKEWEMASIDLRKYSGLEDRKRLAKALDELQMKMRVIPCEVLYEPKFTYIWTLPEVRFSEHYAQKVTRNDALREVARAFLHMQGQTKLGELSRTLGLSRKDAGIGNHQLVFEGLAERLSVGVYRLRDWEALTP
jgi:hypothetical protein